MPCTHRSRAFTLIELLMVVSILAILVALLLPAIATVRARANAVACMAHLRQIPLAIIAYADQTNGRLVLGKWGFNPVQKQWETLLADMVPDVLGGAKRIEDTVASGAPPRRSIVRGCPNFRHAFAAGSVALSWTSGFGLNVRPNLPYNPWQYNWLWSGSGTQFRFDGIRDHAQRVIVGDADDWWMNATGPAQSWGSFLQPREWQDSPNRANGMVRVGQEAYRRHRGRANYGFLDGHVESLASNAALDRLMDPADTLGYNHQ